MADAAIHKKNFGSSFTTLVISNEKINEKSGLLIKGVSGTIKNEVKEQKGRILGMLLGTLGASLLENLLRSKGTIRVGEGAIRAGEKF